MATVALVGALDTKGEEYALARQLVRRHGLGCLLVDVGVRDTPTVAPDIGRDEICAAAGTTLAAVRSGADRSVSLATMADGLRALLTDRHRAGDIDAVLALGGSGAVALCAPAFRALPLGVPKVIATTMAASDLTEVIGASDLIVMPTVVDIAGLNRFSRFTIERAVATVAALAGVPAAGARSGAVPIALTMLGVTTAGVTATRRRLDAAGFETMIFHANGVGGRTLEALVAEGWIDAVVDLTTGELASGLVGGTADAGPTRLTAAGQRGVPQVVSIGGCDLAIFGATPPAAYADRLLYRHGPTATLMRTSPEECARIGATIAERLAQARGPVRVLLPAEGLSTLSEPGGPFHDPVADDAVRDALRSALPCVDVPGSINGEAFADAAAAAVMSDLREAGTR